MRVDVPEYKTFVDFPDGTDPAEIQKVMAQNFPPKKAETTPEAKPGLVSGVNEAIVKRGVNIADELNAPSSETVGQTLKNAPERALRATGQTATLGGDVAMEGIKGLYGLLPKSAQDAITGIPKSVLGKELAPVMEKDLLSMLGQGAEKYAQFKQENPNAAKDLEALVNIGTAIPIGKGAQLSAPLIGKATTAVGKGAAAATVKPLSKVVKEVVGAYTGRGPGFVEEMVKGSEAAEKAMRGEITGEEVVEHAKNALQKVRDLRSKEYLQKLDTVRANPEELQAVRSGVESKLATLADKDHFELGIDVGKDGVPKVDFSKSTIIEHQKVVERAIEDVLTWNDNTARGLDTLTKRLSKYVDQAGRGTPAESFVTQLKNDISGGLKKTVPEYEDMTKGYREASTLIKDIESNLMLRKEGMTGRITADQTLRRLSSALLEGKEMRKDLLLALGTQSGMDIPGEVAGYLAKQWIPAGIMGKGLTMGSAWSLHFLSPQWWPVLAASSPRVVGEFLNAYGKTLRTVKTGVKKTQSNMAEMLK
ncbi:MAG: hypothetical protein WC455_17330 [Dehalococcoidia bacterium]|jgi:hypothetical protein